MMEIFASVSDAIHECLKADPVHPKTTHLGLKPSEFV